jgi:bifunctional UDP-N-acetylglucosamine pyrophosphorylase/glucosamine-1-phosphate N-acetyltransferase
MSSQQKLAVVVLAAGKGTRMRSEKAKVLHELAGRSLLLHALEALDPLAPEQTVVVVGHQAEAVRASVESRTPAFAVQEEQKGTGHAVKIARDAALANFHGDVLITYGDVPLLTSETLKRLVAKHRTAGAGLSMLTMQLDDAQSYGRIVRDDAGSVLRITEAKDATEAELAIGEANAGIFCVRSDLLFPALDALRANNAQGEFYLTDVVAFVVEQGQTVATETVPATEVEGVNSRADLARLEAVLRETVVARHMDAGVTFLDPASVLIEIDVEIGADTIIGPQVQLRGRTTIGRDCEFLGNAHLTNARIGDRVRIRQNVVIDDAQVGDGAVLGPFSHLRPGADLGEEVHVGNFVEVKKSKLGRGTKASHLSYLGDATIGSETNIGAGTITCNYDGFGKAQTTIGDRVQIGSDSQLVAPVEIGDDAYVATGTTVRHDVPAGALAFNPKPDKRREGWVESFRARARAKKKPPGR